MWCYLLKELIDLNPGVNWLYRPLMLRGPDPWRLESWGGHQRKWGPVSPEWLRHQTHGRCREVFMLSSTHLTAHTHSFSAHYDAGDVDERWEWAHRLRRLLDLPLSVFFIRLFQTLNVSLYNSSQPLQSPRVWGSFPGEETATYKGRSAPRPAIWRNSNHNKTPFKTEHVHSYTHFHSCT